MTTPLTCLQLRQQNVAAFSRTPDALSLLWHFPLRHNDVFDAIHAAAMQAIARQTAVDWTQTYAVVQASVPTSRQSSLQSPLAGGSQPSSTAAIDAPTLIATLLTAVIDVLCPAIVPFNSFLEPIIAAVNAATQTDCYRG